MDGHAKVWQWMYVVYVGNGDDARATEQCLSSTRCKASGNVARIKSLTRAAFPRMSRLSSTYAQTGNRTPPPTLVAVRRVTHMRPALLGRPPQTLVAVHQVTHTRPAPLDGKPGAREAERERQKRNKERGRESGREREIR